MGRLIGLLVSHLVAPVVCWISGGVRFIFSALLYLGLASALVTPKNFQTFLKSPRFGGDFFSCKYRGAIGNPSFYRWSIAALAHTSWAKTPVARAAIG
jgi:hypothetical protein